MIIVTTYTNGRYKKARAVNFTPSQAMTPEHQTYSLSRYITKEKISRVNADIKWKNCLTIKGRKYEQNLT